MSSIVVMPLTASFDVGRAQISGERAQRRVVDDKGVGVVVGVEVVRQLAQVVYKQMRCALRGGAVDQFWVAG